MAYSRIAYNEELKSYIKCKNYICDTYWFYVQCDENGVEHGNVQKTENDFRALNWREVIK